MVEGESERPVSDVWSLKAVIMKRWGFRGDRGAEV